MKDDKGELVLSKLDEAGLHEMAAATGGEYVRSMAGDLDLDLLYFDGIKQKTDAAVVKSGKIKVHEERFFIFAAAGFLLLLLEGMFGHLKHKRFGLLAMAFLLLLTLTEGYAAENPDELYTQGRFEEAAKGYADQDMDNPRDIRYRYNRGCADYQASDFKGAMAAFSSVLKRTDDPETRVKALFNLGNAAYKKGDFTAAIAYYQQAIVLDPANENARYNLELALKELEKQKKREEEKKKQEQQQKNRKKKNAPKDHKEGEEEPSQEKSEPDQTDQKQDQKRDESPQENSRNAGDKNAPQTSEPEAQKPEPVPAVPMEKQKAEALLDNIKENRARFLKFQMPETKTPKASSGKDW